MGDAEDQGGEEASADTLPISASDSTIPPPRDGDLPPGTRVQRYVILRTLGRGGMGVVYMAFDQELDRRVALKLLSSDSQVSDGSEESLRLLREAQAMAKLSHPNVVAVFDVGKLGAQVFLAMEYVDGTTLRAWRERKPRSWREIVATYLQAGRGLEAAHEAGIFHRDFKPENVVVDGGGRVRVLDFGLARIDASVARLDELALATTGTSSSKRAPVTVAGTLMGTPGYMAPEQTRGERADARSDQFAFAVALHEALYGERPFEGKLLREVLDGIINERVRPAPPRTSVPRAVRKVLLRGLRARSADRYPTMAALLGDLERTTSARRKQIALTASLVAAGAIAAAVSARASRPSPCAGADVEIAQTWGPTQREAMAAAFVASGNPQAKDTWWRVKSSLDAYASGWATMRTESCEATRVHGAQSDEALDLRTACLDQRRRELTATAGILTRGDAKLVDDAVRMVRALPDLAECADVSSLRAPYAEPHDPEKRRAVDALRKELAEGTVLVNARRTAEAAGILESAARDAKAAGNRPLEAAARVLIGRTELSRGKTKDAAATLRDAAEEASAVRDDATEASAWTVLVRVAGFDLGRFDESEIYAGMASVAIERAGGSAALRATLLLYRGYARYARPELEEALALYRQALALREEALGAGSPEAAEIEIDLGDVEMDEGHLHDARAHFESALAKRRAIFGEGNPTVGLELLNLSIVEEVQGDADEAVRSARRALAVIRPDDERHPSARAALGQALIAQGDARGGLAEALAGIAEIVTPSDWRVGTMHANLADALLRRHETPRASAEAEAAISFLSKAETYQDVLRTAKQDRALCLTRGGNPRDGLREAAGALSAEEKESGVKSERLMVPLLAVGEAALALRDAPRAVDAMERAAAIAENAEGAPALHADIHLALARALLEARGDAERARAACMRAAREYEGARLPDLAASARAIAAEGE